jgi:copper(I)-binding protein
MIKRRAMRVSLRGMAAACALFAACGVWAAEVTLKTAWMRPAASGMAEAMVYVDIVSEVSLDLVGASTPVARRVELVDVNLKTDPPESKVVASMPVAAGKTTRLAYRGSHLRLVGINKDLGNGASVPLTLMFKSADGKEIRASVDAQVRGLLTPQQMPAVVSRDPEPAARESDPAKSK